MKRKRASVEQIIGKRREAEVQFSQGRIVKEGYMGEGGLAKGIFSLLGVFVLP
jgi:hypothetical protein